MISNAIGGSTFPGLQLKAWALINGANNTLLKGMNVSSISGTYGAGLSINFNTAMTSANYVAKLFSGDAGAGWAQFISGKTTTSCTARVDISGTGQPNLFYVEFWE